MKFFENVLVGKNHWLLYVALLFVGYFAAQIPGTIYVVALIIGKMSSGDKDWLPQMLEGGNVMAIFDTIPGFIAFMLTFAVWLGAMWLLFKPFHKRERMTLISGDMTFRKQHFFLGCLVYGVMMLLSAGLFMATNPESYTMNFQGAKYFWFLFLCILLVPFQTACEEVIFRGYLMQGFAICTKSKVWALVITSVLFGLLHCANNEVLENGFFTAIPVYIEIGLSLGFFAILSDGIEISYGMHFVNNFIAFVITSSEGGTLSGNALFILKGGSITAADYIVPVVVAVVMYFCLRKKMGWDIKKAFECNELVKIS